MAHSGVMCHDAYPLEQALNDLWTDQGSMVLVIKFDGVVAGFIRFFNVQYKGSKIHCLEAGTAFDQKFWGDPRVVGSCRDVISKLFEQNGIFRLEARTLQRNERANAFIQRLGFTLEGELRGRLSIKGQPRTEMVYGIIRPQYFTRR